MAHIFLSGGTKMNTEVTIIGGGISGLHTAYQLQKRGINFILIEARDRLGGRILSNNYSLGSSKPSKSLDESASYDANKPAYDLGPSWFWPHQKNIANLIEELNLSASVFPQYTNGESVYEDQQGNAQKGFYGISMEGAYRINGGMAEIIEKLEEQIDDNKIIKSSPVSSVKYNRDNDYQVITTYYHDHQNQDEQKTINSKKVVVALPPRIAMSSIDFHPSLSQSRDTELNSYATWMAGHAKVIIVYEQPFWLEQGLSGDAVSHLGPLREIHDASSQLKTSNDDNDNHGYALFGFVGLPGSYRAGNVDEICNASIAQLVRLFGEKAKNPMSIVMQDWAQEKFTATEIDQSMNGGHASSSIRLYCESNFDDRLIWSGTETADHQQGSNGLLEGAIESSIRSLNIIN